MAAPERHGPASSGLPPKRRYRPEIDGLRAVAVIAVIINHISKDVLPTGYLGVDIFFVISGYVITASLEGRQSRDFGDFLTGFYERRIKRLLPALIVFVVLTSLLICVVNPDPVDTLMNGVKALFGVTNIALFASATDYFGQATELNPFMHTWSLGVEEQFYLIFPILIWFSGFGRQAARGSRQLLCWVLGLSVASLLAFLWFYPLNQPAAYFLMPLRFWELAAGCLVLLGLERRAVVQPLLKRTPPLLVLVLMLVVMVCQMDGRQATLLMVLLTALLIAAIKPDTRAYRVLTQRYVVYIGLISYSLYLWHWGVLCIARWSFGVSIWSAPALILLSLGLSMASYHWIEKPFRAWKLKRRRTTFLAGLLGLTAGTAAIQGLSAPAVHARLSAVHVESGRFQRGRQSQTSYVGPVTGRRNADCLNDATVISRAAIRAQLKTCSWHDPVKGDRGPIVAIIGDSHALQLFPIGEQIAKELRVPLYNLHYGNCLVPQDDSKLESPKCANVNKVPEWVYDEFRRPIIFVVASIADPMLHFPWEKDQHQRARAFRKAFENVLNKGNYLVVVAPNPKFFDINNSISDVCGGATWSQFNPICTRDYKFEARIQRFMKRFYLEDLRRWAREDRRVVVVDPFDILCGEKDGYCHAGLGDQAKYWDLSHLNIGAVMSTYPLYKKAIQELLQRAVQDQRSAGR